MQIEIGLGDVKIHSAETVKFLGMWIDNQLTWKRHINNVILKIKQNTNLLKISNKYLTEATKK